MKIIIYIIMFICAVSDLGAQESFKSKGLLGGSFSGAMGKDVSSLAMKSYVGMCYATRWSSGFLMQFEEVHSILPIFSEPTPTLDSDLGFGIFTRFCINSEKKLRIVLESSFLRVTNKYTYFHKDKFPKSYRKVFLQIGLTPKVLYNVYRKWNIIIDFGQVRYRKSQTERGGKSVHFSSKIGIRR